MLGVHRFNQSQFLTSGKRRFKLADVSLWLHTHRGRENASLSSEGISASAVIRSVKSHTNYLCGRPLIALS